jgi:hypothetical protein
LQKTSKQKQNKKQKQKKQPKTKQTNQQCSILNKKTMGVHPVRIVLQKL